jgi:hypothetical protein
MQTWWLYSASLAPYAGSQVRIRFFFDTIDGLGNGYRGWYVDDVAIRSCDSSDPGGDPDGDGLTNAEEAALATDPCVVDTDRDGCADSEELAGAPAPEPGSTGPYEALAWYDFFDVPVPASPDPTPNGPRNQAIATADILAVLLYVGTYHGDGGTPSAKGVAYDIVKGSCDVDGDTVSDKEGLCYDRSVSTEPNPPWAAGPPDGAVNMADVLGLLAQVGLDCRGAP